MTLPPAKAAEESVVVFLLSKTPAVIVQRLEASGVVRCSGCDPLGHLLHPEQFFEQGLEC